MADQIEDPEDDPGNVFLRLSAQRALLGNVGASVRSVTVAYEGRRVVFRATVDQDASDDTRQDLDDAAGQVIGDYPPGWTLNVVIGTDDVAHPRWPELVYQRRPGEKPAR